MAKTRKYEGGAFYLWTVDGSILDSEQWEIVFDFFKKASGLKIRKSWDDVDGTNIMEKINVAGFCSVGKARIGLGIVFSEQTRGIWAIMGNNWMRGPG